MPDVARAVHKVARVYGSLEEALSMTPRRLAAVLELESEARGAELSDLLVVQRVAANGERKDVEKALKELGHG